MNAHHCNAGPRNETPFSADSATTFVLPPPLPCSGDLRRHAITPGVVALPPRNHHRSQCGRRFRSRIPASVTPADARRTAAANGRFRGNRSALSVHPVPEPPDRPRSSAAGMIRVRTPVDERVIAARRAMRRETTEPDPEITSRICLHATRAPAPKPLRQYPGSAAAALPPRPGRRREGRLRAGRHDHNPASPPGVSTIASRADQWWDPTSAADTRPRQPRRLSKRRKRTEAREPGRAPGLMPRCESWAVSRDRRPFRAAAPQADPSTSLALGVRLE